MNLFGNAPNVYLIAAVFALLTTILVFLFVMPKDRDGKLGGGLLQFLHDLFHFKRLYLEPILKFLYTLSTFLVFFTGLVGLILGLSNAVQYGIWTPVLYFLAILVLGPIALRIVYEFAIMGVLLVRNVTDINRKLKREPRPRQEEPRPMRETMRQNAAAVPQAIRYAYCRRCGGKYNAELPVCPYCGRANV